MELSTGAHIDRFLVEATIGSGGMATVYRVRHRDLDTVHALKVLHLTHPSVQDRILAEGRVQARLRHPNVVSVTDVIDVGGNPGLLMEYIRGPSLERVLGRVQLELPIVEHLVPGILAGVAAAHHENLVHRDLKPGNILLEVNDQRVLPKIADFGLVKLLDDHRTGLTASGATMGTPNYMSPEQIKNARAVDARTDLFSLGTILYEMVTGTRAFESDNVFGVLSAISGGELEPLSHRRPGLPGRIVRAIEAALALDAEDRVADCDELWSLWCADREPLAAAAARQVVMSPAWAMRLADLAPRTQVPVRRATTPRQPRPVADPGATGATFPVPDPVPRRRWVPLVLGGLVGLLLLAVALAVITNRHRSSEPRPNEPRASIEPVPVVEPVAEPPAVAPVPEPLPEPVPEPLPEPVRPRVVVPRPAPVPSEPSPAVPVESAVVRVQGDARVRLTGADGAVVSELGAVPPGSYRVEAIYGAGDWTSVGRLDVTPGTDVVVSCESAIRNCKW